MKTVLLLLLSANLWAGLPFWAERPSRSNPNDPRSPNYAGAPATAPTPSPGTGWTGAVLQTWSYGYGITSLYGIGYSATNGVVPGVVLAGFYHPASTNGAVTANLDGSASSVPWRVGATTGVVVEAIATCPNADLGNSASSQVFAIGGGRLRRWAVAVGAGTEDVNVVLSPGGVTVSNCRGMAVDRYGSLVFGSDGNRVFCVFQNGVSPAVVTGTTFNSPTGICADPSADIVWVADTGNNRVVRLTGTGGSNVWTPGLTFSVPSPTAIATSGGQVFVYTGGEIRRYSAAGAYLSTVCGGLPAITAMTIPALLSPQQILAVSGGNVLRIQP